ncbi:MAG TPA: LpqB family beta-propeller domain-containing protein [Mycobacteriales bacterium]|nr:LpqB family beta-propeller domain-containing protein [Mycobacteriales bacterium]
MPRAASVAAVVALAIAVAGCSGIPRDGEVRSVRPVVAPEDRTELDRGPRNGPVFRRFPPPPPNASPEQVVRGFFDAHADIQPNQQVARQYLAPLEPWAARAQVTVFTGERTFGIVPVDGTRQSATLTVTPTATISRDGEFRPVPTRPTVLRFGLRLVDGEWRLVDVPDGLLLSDSGLAGAYRRTVRYFPGPDRRRLVPDLVLLPRGSASAVTSAAQSVVDGPSPWLAPVVRTAVPESTAVIGAVPVIDGTATVNLSRHALSVLPAARAALVAQLVWTLTEPGLGVGGVRLQVDGRRMVLPDGRTGAIQSRSDWAGFNPDPGSDSARLYFLRSGRLHTLEGEEVAEVRAEPAQLRDIAVSRSAALIAAVRRNADGTESLLVGALSGSLPALVTGRRVLSPSWDSDGDRVWALVDTVQGRTLMSVPAGGASGASQAVPVDLPAGAVLESVRLSPEGGRAVLVLRTGAVRQPWLARVERLGGAPALAALQPVRPSGRDTASAVWETATRLLLVDGTEVARADADGFDPVPVPSDGLPPRRVQRVTGGPSADVVAEIDGRLWRRASGWRLIAPGTAAAYAG